VLVNEHKHLHVMVDVMPCLPVFVACWLLNHWMVTISWSVDQCTSLYYGS